MAPGGVAGFVARRLSAADAAAVHGAHRSILAGLPRPDFLTARSLDFFQRCCGPDGATVGAFHKDELAGYGTLRFPTAPDASHAGHLGHLGVDSGDVAEGVGCAVVPKYRGRGLFSWLVAERNRVARRLGFAFQTSIVSPGNLQALQATLRAGFFLAARYVDEDGDNYLVVKDLCRPTIPPNGAGPSTALADVELNLQYLDEGLCGFPEGEGTSIRLRFGPVWHHRPALGPSRQPVTGHASDPCENGSGGCPPGARESPRP